MLRELLISVDENETRVALVEDGELEELFIERQSERHLAGSIYKGRVESIHPGMEAAFVDIALEKDGFLYVGDVAAELDELGEIAGSDLLEENDTARIGSRHTIGEMLKRGQEVLVQVVKEPIGTKGARLTSYVSLPGRYLVLMPTVEHVGVSRRISAQKERERLRQLIRELRPAGMGCIVRTAGEGKDRREFFADMRYLVNTWRQVEKGSRRTGAPGIIHEEAGLAMRVARDMFTEEIDKLILDSKHEWVRIRKFMQAVAPSLAGRVELYRGPKPLFTSRGLEEEIEKALHRTVNLRSGGTIVIEETEALVSVDVNSGRSTGRESLEKTALDTNLEAASEIARQLRLRGLGGLIVIDFIDMESERNRRRVVSRLEEALKRDRAKTTVAKLSEMGIVEMTRQRTRRSLASFLCASCPYCGGTGRVESVATTSIRIQRRLLEVLRGLPERSLIVRAHPDVVARFEKEDAGKLREIQRRLHRRIRMEKVPSFHLEDVRIVSARSGQELA